MHEWYNRTNKKENNDNLEIYVFFSKKFKKFVGSIKEKRKIKNI